MTSVWERWDGWTPERGFQDPGMNSFAHYAYGAVVGWMFQHVGGIRETSPGFATVRIESKWNAELKFAKTRFDSVRGPKWCYPMGVPARPGRGRGKC